ncbi:MAG: acyl carrier protein [Bacillota bacterium]|jgi:acyl carrier protein
MTTIEKVKEIIADQLGLGVDEINDDSKVKDDLGADSLDMVELVMALEEEFSLKIAEEELQKIVTVNDVAKYIESKA